MSDGFFSPPGFGHLLKSGPAYPEKFRREAVQLVRHGQKVLRNYGLGEPANYG